MEPRHQRRLALEGALADELPEVELGDVGGAEPEIDPGEDVSRVVADDRGAHPRAGEAAGEGVEVARALLPAREHRTYPVVVRMPSREQRHPPKGRVRGSET